MYTIFLVSVSLLLSSATAMSFDAASARLLQELNHGLQFRQLPAYAYTEAGARCGACSFFFLIKSFFSFTGCSDTSGNCMAV